MDTLFPVFSRSGREGNFGFRRFLDRHATMKAVDALNRSSICGRRLIVKLASYSWSHFTEKDDLLGGRKVESRPFPNRHVDSP